MFKCYPGSSTPPLPSRYINRSRLKKIASHSLLHRKKQPLRNLLHLKKNTFEPVSTARSVSHLKARSSARAAIAVKHVNVILTMMNGFHNINNLFIILFDCK